MNYHDEYIEDFFFYHFQEDPLHNIPRIKTEEQRQIELSRAEYLLAYDLESLMAKYSLINDVYKERVRKIALKFNPQGGHYYISKESNNLVVLFIKYSGLEKGNIEQKLLDLLRDELNKEDFSLPSNNFTNYFAIETYESGKQQYVSNFIKSNNLHYRIIERKISAKEKMVLPSQVHYGKDLHVLPSKEQRILLNLDWVANSSSVIITDSIKLASENQKRVITTGIVTELTWTAWFDGEKDIEATDWTPLKGKRIYYLLKIHSGQTNRETLSTGHAVRNHLINNGITNDNDFKFVSLLLNHQNTNEINYQKRAYPLIYSYAQLQTLQGLRSVAPHFSNIPFSKSYTQPKPNREILSPFLYDNSITLIYGDENCLKTFWALHMAYAVSLNKMMIAGFSGRGESRGGGVLYFYNAKHTSSIGSKCETLNTIYQKRKRVHSFVDYENSNLKLIPVLVNGNGNSNPDVVNYITQTVAVSGNKTKLLIIDSILHCEKTENLNNVRHLIRWLKSYDYAIIIIPPCKTTIKDRNAICNLLPVDNIIRFKKDPIADEATKVHSTLKIEKALQLPCELVKPFTYELDFSSTKNPILRRKVKYADLHEAQYFKLSDEKKGAVIEWAHRQGEKIRATAKRLNISESEVKKRRGLLGLSKKREKK